MSTSELGFFEMLTNLFMNIKLRCLNAAFSHKSRACPQPTDWKSCLILLRACECFMCALQVGPVIPYFVIIQTWNLHRHYYQITQCCATGLCKLTTVLTSHNKSRPRPGYSKPITHIYVVHITVVQ